MPNSKPPENPPDTGRGDEAGPGSAVLGPVARTILEVFLRTRLHWQGQRSDRMSLPLTPDRLALQTAQASAKIAQALAELARCDAIAVRADAIYVIDPDKLADVAGVDPAELLSRLRD